MNSEIIFILNGLNKNLNGIDTSFISRLRLLRSCGIKNLTVVILRNFDNFDEVVRKFFNDNELLSSLKIVRPYNEILEIATEPKATSQDHRVIKNLATHPQGPSIHYINQEKQSVGYTRKDGSIFFSVTPSEASNAPQTETSSKIQFYPNGLPYKIVTYQTINNTILPTTSTFFKENGQISIVENFHTESTTPLVHSTYSVTLFESGKPIACFSNVEHFFSYWVQQYLSAHPQAIVVMDHLQYIESYTANISNKIIACLHSNHHYNFTSHIGINPMNRYVFENPNKVSKLIVLSERQKKDILLKYNFGDKIKVIPHHLSESNVVQVDRDPNLCIALCNLTANKRIIEMISLFERATHDLPNVRLQIYGEGKFRPQIEKYINSKQLNDRVKLMGFCRNTDEILASAKVLLSTSYLEGLPMSMLEALRQHTPVLAFNADYGVDQIITHKLNGLIAEIGDDEAWVNNLRMVLTDNALYQHLSINSEVDSRQSALNFCNSWIEVLEECQQ